MGSACRASLSAAARRVVERDETETADDVRRHRATGAPAPLAALLGHREQRDQGHHEGDGSPPVDADQARSVAEVERRTGYVFLDRVDSVVAGKLKGKVDALFTLLQGANAEVIGLPRKRPSDAA